MTHTGSPYSPSTASSRSTSACRSRSWARPATSDGDRLYQVRVTTADGQPVRTSAGFSVLPEHGPEILDDADTVIVPGIHPPSRAGSGHARPGRGGRARPDPARRPTGLHLYGRLRARRDRPARRPTGHHPLGLGRRSSGQLFPKVDLNPDVLFVDDGDVLTSAGVAAGVDLCLHLVRRDFGVEVANRAARRCVVPPWRDGGQAQFIERVVPATPDDLDRPGPASGRCPAWTSRSISPHWPVRPG